MRVATQAPSSFVSCDSPFSSKAEGCLIPAGFTGQSSSLHSTNTCAASLDRRSGGTIGDFNHTVYPWATKEGAYEITCRQSIPHYCRRCTTWEGVTEWRYCLGVMRQG